MAAATTDRTFDGIPSQTQMRALAAELISARYRDSTGELAAFTICVEFGPRRVAANDGIYVPASLAPSDAVHVLFSCDISHLSRCKLRYHGTTTARDAAAARVERRFASGSSVPNRSAPLRVDSFFLRASAATVECDANMEELTGDVVVVDDDDVPRIFIYDGAPLVAVNAYVLATAPLERLRALIHLRGVYTTQWWLGAADDSDVTRDRVATLVLVVALCRAPPRVQAWYVCSEQRVLRLQLRVRTSAQVRAFARHCNVDDADDGLIERLVAVHGARLEALLRAAAASPKTRLGDDIPLLADAVQQCCAVEEANRAVDENAYLEL